MKFEDKPAVGLFILSLILSVVLIKACNVEAPKRDEIVVEEDR